MTACPGPLTLGRRGLLRIAGLSAVVAACGGGRRKSAATPGDTGGSLVTQTDVLAATRPVEIPGAQAFLVGVPVAVRDRALRLLPSELAEGVNAGVLALSRQCPAPEGCAVAFCASSAWFECPCCGSQFDQLGDKKSGPAPRGMSMLAIHIVDGSVRVIPTPALPGVPFRTPLVSQSAAGPHCR